MNNEKSQLIINALSEALALISGEYETLQDEELREEYDNVIEKLQNAIKQAKTYD